MIEFGSREDGYIRPSDHQESRSDFVRREYIPFGETAPAPPDLKTFIHQLDKKKANKAQEQQKALSSLLLSSTEEISHSASERDEKEDDDEEEDAGRTTTMTTKKRKRKMDWDKFNADDSSEKGFGFASSSHFQHLPSDPLALITLQRKQRQSTQSLSHQQDLEQQRKEIQAQYKLMREKKKKHF